MAITRLAEADAEALSFVSNLPNLLLDWDFSHLRPSAHQGFSKAPTLRSSCVSLLHCKLRGVVVLADRRVEDSCRCLHRCLVDRVDVPAVCTKGCWVCLGSRTRDQKSRALWLSLIAMLVLVSNKIFIDERFKCDIGNRLKGPCASIVKSAKKCWELHLASFLYDNAKEAFSAAPRPSYTTETPANLHSHSSSSSPNFLVWFWIVRFHCGNSPFYYTVFAQTIILSHSVFFLGCRVVCSKQTHFRTQWKSACLAVKLNVGVFEWINCYCTN